MKLLLKVFLAFVVLSALFVGGYHFKKKMDAKDLSSMLTAQSVDKDAKRKAAEAAAPKPAPTPPPFTEAQLATLQNALANAAKAAQVSIKGYQVGNGRLYVTVQWKGGNMARGGDFVDALLKSGTIVDFNDRGKQSQTVQGEYLHTLALELVPA
ncbi:MAG: hypothetical protein RLY93_16910 [Sumerlaeia bacterium]